VGSDVIIQAKLETESDLKECIEFSSNEMGIDPSDVNWESLTIEFNLPSYGERIIYLDYLKEKGAEILKDGIDDDF